MGISVRLWQNHKRKYAIRSKLLHMNYYDENLIQYVEYMGNQPEEAIVQKEIIQAVREGIKKLPDKLQTVLYMYYTAELSVEEIGAALHIPKGTVKSRLYKGRLLLKEYLEVLGYE